MYISGIMDLIWGLFLMLDSVIYNLIRWVYEIFIDITNLNLFSENEYQTIVTRFYLILGVFMLFVLAYSLLKAVINPDDFAKGENSFPNLIKNIVISLVIIAVLPTVFTFATNVQTAVLNQDTIPKLILNDYGADASNMKNNGGNTMAYWTFRAFLHPNADWCISKGYVNNGIADFDTCAQNIEPASGWLDWFVNKPTLAETYNRVANGNSFFLFTAFSKSIDDGTVDYLILIPTLVGGAMVFILLSYCIALALRAVKLAFYQIIAPIPVICRVLPGDKKKVFDNWVKQIIGTFIDVFIRIAIMYIGVFVITLIVDKIMKPSVGAGSFGSAGTLGLISIGSINLASIFPFAGYIGALGPIQKLLEGAFMILGVLMFVRSAPGMLKDLFGFDVGGSLNPFKIFQDGITAAAPVAGFVGGAALGLSHGLIDRSKANFGAGSKFAEAKGLGKVWHGAGAVLSTLRSGVAGSLAAGGRSAYNNRNVKSMKDMTSGITRGVETTDRKTAQHIKYRADHNNSFFDSMGGHIADFGRSAVRTLGFSSGIEVLKADNDAITEIENASKAVGDGVKTMIEKAIAKGDYDNTFGTSFRVRDLVELDQEIKAAEGRGDVAAMRSAQTQRNNLFKAMTDEMKTVAGSSSRDIDRLSNDLKKSYADVFLAANTFRSVARKYTNKGYVQKAGIDQEYLNENKNIDFANASELKSLEANMIDQRRHNNEDINRLVQKEQKKDNNGSH